MESGKHGGAKSFMHRPAVRIGIIVVAVHAVCWLAWDLVKPGASGNNAAVAANAQQARIRAALDAKN